MNNGLLLALSIFSLVNITHIEGLSSDFSNLVLEVVTGNESYAPDFEIISMEENSWVLVNVSVPESNYTLNIFSSAGNNSYVPTYEPGILEISYQEGFEPDFSNLAVEFVDDTGKAERVAYSIIALNEGSWIAIALEREPAESETIRILAVDRQVTIPATPDDTTPTTSDNATIAMPEPDNTPPVTSDNATTLQPANATPDTATPLPDIAPPPDIATANDLPTVELDVEDASGLDIETSVEILGDIESGPENESYDVVLKPEGVPLEEIAFHNIGPQADLSGLLRLDDVPESIPGPDGRTWAEVYAIDPTNLDFSEATVTVVAKGTALYKCKDWNFGARRCAGGWALLRDDLIPGEEYTITLTPEDPGFGEVIEISNARHLDENKSFISDIYDQVKALDNVWSEPIYENEYVRITFREKLTAENDITLYSRNNQNLNTYVEVYYFNSTDKITEFPIMADERYYKVLLTGMSGAHDTFDLKIVNPDPDVAYLEFDHIIDPDSNVSACQVINAGGIYTLNQSIVSGTPQSFGAFFGSTCIGINTSNVVLNCAGFTIDAGTSGMATGIIAADSEILTSLNNITIANCTVTGNFSTGIEISNVENSTITNNTVYNLTGVGGTGFLLDSLNSGTLVTNNTAGNLTDNGFKMSGSVGSNTLIGNLAYNTSIGFLIGSDLNNLTSNTAYNNTAKGFHVLAANSTLINNTAHDNGQGFGFNGGFVIECCSANDNLLVNNTAYSNNGRGFYQYYSPGSLFANNTAYNNFKHGIFVEGDAATLDDNTAYNNTLNGFYLLNSVSANFTGNTAYNNTQHGFHIDSSDNNNLTGNTAYGNALSGIKIEFGNNNAVSGGHLYNNNPDFTFETGILLVVNLSAVIFDNPAGDFTNYTNISLNASNDDDVLTLNWSAEPAPLPGLASFANKHLNITGGSLVTLDSVVWHWLDNEPGAVNEANFELWKYNGTWNQLNTTPDTAGNTLSISNLTSFSVFSILQNTVCPAPITSAGSYSLSGNIFGAPNNASPLINTTCIKIASSDVIFDCNGFNITNNGTDGTTYGILLNGSLTNVTIQNCPAVSEYSYGVYIYQSNDSLITNSTANGNGYGFYLDSSSNNNLTDNSAFNSSGHGFFLSGGSNGNNLINSTAYNNSNSGFVISSDLNNLTNNTAYNNSYRGFHVNGADNNLTNNTAFSNIFSGFFIECCGADNTLIINNTAYLNLESGFYQYYSTGTLFANNTAYNNAEHGIFVEGDPATLDNNTAYNNTLNGFYLLDSDLANFTNNTAYNNTQHGFHIDFSDNNTLTGNTAYGNVLSGIKIEFGNNNAVSGGHLYNNSPDFTFETGILMTVNLSAVVFDNPAGDFTNYTNLSLNASNDDDVLTLNWSAEPAPLPGSHDSFANKHLNITGGSLVTLDSAVWHWLDSEPGAANETNFELWKYNGTWNQLNATLDTAGNTLSISNLTGFSVFSILQTTTDCPAPITSNGSYSLGGNVEGAPNDASEIPSGGAACVKIASSDVTFDCNGFNITNNGTGGTTFGILLNGSLTNVTIKNCPAISNYTYGVYFYQSNDSNVTNSTAKYNAKVGFNLDASHRNTLADDSANGNANGFRLTMFSDENNLTDNTAYNNSEVGFLINGAATNNSLTNNTAYNNTLAGFAIENSTNNTLTNNTAVDNNPTNTTLGSFLLGGFAIVSSSSNNTLINNTALRNQPYGFSIDAGSENNTITNAIASNNSLDGLIIRSSNSNQIDPSFFCNNTGNGITVNNSNNTIIDDSVACNNTANGIEIINSNNTLVNRSQVYNNSEGIFMTNATFSNFTNSNITNNSNNGIRFDPGSTDASLFSNYVCGNSLDIDNLGSANAGSMDRCDSFISWTENGHFGCEFSCSSMWHRFFGNVSGQLILGHNETPPYVYNWTGTGFNVYFADYDSAIDWFQLQAIGRTTANATSSDDFTELDTAFNTTSFGDNINKTYSTDGSSPIETDNYTVFLRPVNFVPVANSTAFNTTFNTGILWDMADGGTEYSNSFNQSTVWVVKVNSTADVYGTYDYLIQIPYTLATYEGNNSLVSVYLELK